jgi:hypothetical protein
MRSAPAATAPPQGDRQVAQFQPQGAALVWRDVGVVENGAPLVACRYRMSLTQFGTSRSRAFKSLIARAGARP